MIGDALKSAIGGSALGAASAAMSAKMNYRYAKKYAENSPMWQMAGLRKAGLNPILAAAKFGGSNNAMPVSAMDLAGSTEKVSSSSAKDSASKLSDEMSNTEKAKQDLLQKQIDKAHWEAFSASVQAFKDDLLRGAYEKSVVQKIAPVLRAFSESGAGLSSAAAVGRLLK